MKIYLLWHEHEGDGKLIGVFSSREKAEGAINILLEKPGFRDFPQDFSIDRYELDKKYWEDGFISI